MDKLFDKAIIGGEGHALAFVTNLLQASTEYAIIGLNLDGEVLLWNVGASKLFGFEPGEMLGKSSFSTFTVDAKDATAFLDIKKVALKKGKWQGNLECKRKNEETFTAHFAVTVHVDTGTPIGLVLVANDITNQMILERVQKLNIEKLEKERFYNRSIIDSINTALIITDPTGKITDLNAESGNLTGYTYDEMLGSMFSRYFVEPERATACILKVMAGESFINQELKIRTKKGLERIVKFNARKVYDQQGEEQGVFTAGDDVTDLNAHEEELNEKTKAMEIAIIAKDRFLASMSHELRTPLNSIIGFTDILKMKISGALTSDQESQLTTINENAKFLLSLINDLLDIAKIESGKFDIKLEKINCQSVIREVGSLLMPQIADKKLQFNLEMPEENIIVYSNRRALKQIIVNLVNNAVKYTETGKIDIKLLNAKVDNKAVVSISVKDTGIGISKIDQDELFKAFKKASVLGEVHEEGTGLGLYLCKELAGLIGAKITFESEAKKGSQFSIILPSSAITKTRILVIEDNESNLKLMTTLLDHFGYEVLSAINGSEGLARALKELPDLILCDIQLPMLSGYEVAGELKKHKEFKTIPIVAVSAFAMLDDRDKALDAGFDSFISKPIDATTFEVQIKKILRGEFKTSNVDG